MGVVDNKFIINKGLANEFIITIKQDNGTLPMVIDANDTFVTKLFKMSDGSKVATLTTTVHDANNGQIKVVISNEVVDSLVVERGDKADYYFTKPVYRLAIDCDTLNNGKFVAKVDKVYVEW